MNNRNPLAGVIHVRGGVHKFLEPDFSDLSVVDLGHVQSKIDRFGSWLPGFYPVAAHTRHVSRLVEQMGGDLNAQRWGLLHDGGEIFIGDFPSPWKRIINMWTGGKLRKLEAGYLKLLGERFGLEFPYPAIVEKADKMLAAIEVRDLWGEDYHDFPWDGNAPTGGWVGITDDYHVSFEEWPIAKELWIKRAKELDLG